MLNRRSLIRMVGALGATSTLPSCVTGPTNRLAIEAPTVVGPVLVEGLPTLLYEVCLSNFTANEINIQHLGVIDARSRRTLWKLSGEELYERLGTMDGRPLGGGALHPGRSAIVYLELTLPSPALPSALTHTIESRLAGASESAISVSARSMVGTHPPSIGPPLRGGPWVGVYHPAWQRGHRRVVRTLEGTGTIPGRFAIDWVRVNEEGAIADGDADITRNHLGYGADVLAVADARVVAARDGMPESATVSGSARHALGDASGNFIALELATARFVFYEHLLPGSVRVTAGQAVQKGEVIAELGFTGDSTGPHLHFHVANGDSPIYSDGMPFVIDQFVLLGHYADIRALGRERWATSNPELDSHRKQERPSPNAVVRFLA